MQVELWAVRKTQSEMDEELLKPAPVNEDPDSPPHKPLPPMPKWMYDGVVLESYDANAPKPSSADVILESDEEAEITPAKIKPSVAPSESGNAGLIKFFLKRHISYNCSAATCNLQIVHADMIYHDSLSAVSASLQVRSSQRMQSPRRRQRKMKSLI